MAVNVAAAMAIQGKKTLLLDLDPQLNSTNYLKTKEEGKTISCTSFTHLDQHKIKSYDLHQKINAFDISSFTSLDDNSPLKKIIRKKTKGEDIYDSESHTLSYERYLKSQDVFENVNADRY